MKKFIARHGLATENAILAGTLTDNGVDKLQVNGSSNLSDIYIGVIHVINSSGEWVGPKVPVFTETFVVSEDQTIFTISGGYDANHIVRVFANGIRVYPGNYTATNGTTITIPDVLQGDNVLIEFCR
jgi:hypothetical protein